MKIITPNKDTLRINCRSRKRSALFARFLTLLEGAPTRGQASFRPGFCLCSWSELWLAVVTDTLVLSWVKGLVPCDMMFSMDLPHFLAWMRQMVIAADRPSEGRGMCTHWEWSSVWGRNAELNRARWKHPVTEISQSYLWCALSGVNTSWCIFYAYGAALGKMG